MATATSTGSVKPVNAPAHGVVAIPIEITTDGSSNVASYKGVGVASVVHAAGQYTITLQGTIRDIVAVSRPTIQQATPNTVIDMDFQVANKTPGKAATVIIDAYVVSTAAAAAAGPVSAKISLIIWGYRSGGNG